MNQAFINVIIKLQMFDDVRFTFGVISEISFPIILHFIAYYNCKLIKSKVIRLLRIVATFD